MGGIKSPQNPTTVAAVVQMVKGLSMEIFSRSLRKNAIRLLTVYVSKTDIVQCHLVKTRKKSPLKMDEHKKRRF